MPEVVTPTAKDWLDVHSAAAEINAGARTIRSAIQSGELRACSINRRGDTRIHRDWLNDWMAQRVFVRA